MLMMKSLRTMIHSKAKEDDYTTQIRTLLKSSGIYALASLASPLISLVLAPFLTHTLSHDEYGALAVLLTIIALTTGLTQLGLNNAFFRTYSYDYESQDDRRKVLSTVVVLLFLISFPTMLIAILVAPWLAQVLLNSPTYADPIRCAAVVILLQNLTVPGLSWLRAENRAMLYSALAVANLLVGLVATIILVGVLHMGIVGALLATGGGYAFIVICTLPLILLRAGLWLRFDMAWNLLSFGVPLVSSFVSVWVLQLSDRYLLSRFGSLAQVASYSVAYTLGGVLGIIVLSPFSLAWPTTMFAIAKREDAKQVFRQIFRWFSCLLLLAAFALSLLSTFILTVLFPASYRSAAPVIPIVTTSILFYGTYNLFTVGVSIQRKTWLAVIFTTAAALINVGLNLLLIPLYGAMGAAASTLLAYAALALIAYIVNQRIYPVPFEIGLFLFGLSIGVLLYAGSAFLAHTQGVLGSSAIYLSALVLYSGCLFVLAARSFQDSRHIYHYARRMLFHAQRSTR